MGLEEAEERIIFKAPEAHSGPWLVSLPGKNKKTQSFFSLTQEKWYERSISMMETHIFCPTPQGWLLMQDSKAHQCFLWNPSTLAKISLPYPPKRAFSRRLSQCVLSSNPTDPNCIVMYVNNAHRRLLFSHPTGKHWILHRVGREWGFPDVIFFKGTFYLITAQGLAVVDLDPRPRITLVLKCAEDLVQYRFWITVNILESCGEMFQVETYTHFWGNTPRPADIIVRKLDFDKKEWVTVDSIGDDRVFFLGTGEPFESSSSRSASALGVKGDCIYYIHKDKGLYTYDLEKETISLELTCQSVQDAGSPLFWLMPSL